ncbi:prepilin peptidase [Staphylococcus pasteuri]|uniref:prepilin peptidase n=1 Tax=Staphylococcus pasteuri TaxID=45972 RepID=UPI000E3C112F|nr:prepilin peptidase [Staphylococcus pasteuri]
MLVYAFFSSILFSFLYQFSTIGKVKLQYLISRSTCDYCKTTIKYIDLIPIFSFLILRGTSRCCHKRLKYNYIIGEILALLPIPLIYYNVIHTNPQIYLTIYLFLLIMSLNDIDYFSINIHFLIMFLLILFFTNHTFPHSFFLTFIISHICYLIIHQYIGYGDILLFNILSLFLPIEYIFYIVLFTFIIGGFISIFIKIFLNPNITRIPLIPFIFLSFIFVSSYFPLLNDFLGGIFI